MNPVASGVGHPARYPVHLINTLRLRDGRCLTLRPILPRDEQRLAGLYDQIGPVDGKPSSAAATAAIATEQLVQLTCVDYHRHMALVVTTMQSGREMLIAEARYLLTDDGDSAGFALRVHERWQRRGVATLVMQALGRVAQDAGANWLNGQVLAGNGAMLALMQRCRFCCTVDTLDPRIVHVETRSRVLGAQRPTTARRYRLLPHWLAHATRTVQ